MINIYKIKHKSLIAAVLTILFLMCCLTLLLLMIGVNREPTRANNVMPVECGILSSTLTAERCIDCFESNGFWKEGSCYNKF